MGWKSKLGKVGGAAKTVGGVALDAGKEGVKVAAATTGVSLAEQIFDKHGDNIGSLIEKVDNIADVVNDHALIFKRLDSLEVNCMTQAQASRLEAKLDKVLALLGEVHADHFGEDK